MEQRLLIRELMVMIPLTLAQVGTYAALRRKVARIWALAFAYVAALAVAINLLGSFWILGFRPRGPFWDLLGFVDELGLTLMFTTTAAYLIYLICHWTGRHLPRPVVEERRQLLKAVGTIAVASPFAAMGYGVFVGRKDFGVRETSLSIPGLHPDLEGLRILHLSDVHLGDFLSGRDFARVIDMANGLRPHLSIMTGDLISRPGDPMQECVKQLARVRSDAGMYGCMGNHEMYAEAEAQVKAEAARRGIPFLRQQHRELKFGNAKLNIGGVDYQRATSRNDYLKGAEKLIVPGALNLLMSHNPDVFPTAAEQGWDLTLSGHTHGGQITIEIVEQTANIMRFFTPYIAGEYQLGNASCYVTRGIGTVGIPARIGVPPEITLLRLRKA